MTESSDYEYEKDLLSNNKHLRKSVNLFEDDSNDENEEELVYINT